MPPPRTSALGAGFWHVDNCHSELVSESLEHEMLKQVQHDKVAGFQGFKFFGGGWNCKRFFGRLRLFNLNRKFNAFPLNDGRLCAFTLAEVLITLTIIGVIAAITIPNLMQNYKKHQVEVGLKEAYSILSTALTIAKTENGINWTEILDNSYNFANSNNKRTNYFAENYLKPYLKVNQTCIYPSTATDNCKIFPYTEWVDYKGQTGTVTTSGLTSSFYRIKLNNNMNLGVAVNSNQAATFVIDINGAQKPNQVGKDIFFFILVAENSGVCDNNANKSSCNDKEIFVAGGEIRYKDYNTTRYCELYPKTCAAVIQKNSWKIPDDYPVKKF